MTWAKNTLGVWMALVATTSMAGTRFEETRIDILGLAPIEAVVMRLPIDESPDFPRRPTADRVDVDLVPVADEVPSGKTEAYLDKFYDFSMGLPEAEGDFEGHVLAEAHGRQRVGPGSCALTGRFCPEAGARGLANSTPFRVPNHRPRRIFVRDRAGGDRQHHDPLLPLRVVT